MGTHKSDRKERIDKKRKRKEPEDGAAVAEKPTKKDRKEKKSKDKDSKKDRKDKEERRKAKEEKKKAKEERKRLKEEKKRAKEEKQAEPTDTPDATIQATSEPEGLQRFPDFSQEQQLSTESALAAARMGIPHWLAHPTTIDRDLTVAATDDRFALSPHTLARCTQEGITDLFAVQAAVIPVLRAAHALSRLRQHVRDLCVSAPTGSGKTLAYVLPIVEKLRQRLVVRLRALVVLPTRDLAMQVKECFDRFCLGTDLRVGLATGDVSLAREQAMLVETAPVRVGGASKVDILVCTPGRLVDHLATPNFSLQHLEFWVMDEADRLLGDAYHEWLPRVQAAVETARAAEPSAVPVHDACTVRDPLIKLQLLARPAPRIQKLLFSATLTQDPAKLARLQLTCPLYIAIAHGPGTFSFPATLREHYATCEPRDKPLMLLYMLWQRRVAGAVCFAKSLEAAHRLAQIVQAWAAQVPDANITVAEYSSDLQAAERSRIMHMFRRGQITLLICSDLIARGLDVGHVEAVINYDVPTHMSQYTHRVGRTARAGRAGSAYTLVEASQAYHFKKMLKENDHWEPFVSRINPEAAVLETLRAQYEKALEQVSEIYN